MLFFYNDIVIVRVSSIMIVEECTVLNCDHKDHERCSMEEQHNSVGMTVMTKITKMWHGKTT